MKKINFKVLFLITGRIDENSLEALSIDIIGKPVRIYQYCTRLLEFVKQLKVLLEKTKSYSKRC